MYAYTTGTLGTLQDTITYTYGNTGWKDQLTNYDGTAISYDASGNPTNWIGNLNALTWNGRQLSSIAMPNNQSINFKYNSDGIRTYKYFIDNDEMYLYQHDYVLDGPMIVGEKVTYNSYYEGMWTKYKYYYYDENGSPIGMNYEGKDYYFQKNILGDIEAIYQGSTKVVQYTYDAWGNVLSVTGSLASTVGQENPFRYRGYYYDTETGLYYLQSRYYDPQVGRFINADDSLYLGASGSVLSCNMYTYCDDNPVINIDPTGHEKLLSLPISFDIVNIIVAASSSIMTSLKVSLISIKAAIISSWNIFLCVVSITGAIGGIALLIRTVKYIKSSSNKVISAVKNMVNKKGVEPEDINNNTVYVICRKYTTDVIYVGITKRYSQRKSEHFGSRGKFNKLLHEMIPIATGLSRMRARAMEQAIITAYTLDSLTNMVNSISPKKWSVFTSEFEQVNLLMLSYADPE